jgi:hypothetical protein
VRKRVERKERERAGRMGGKKEGLKEERESKEERERERKEKRARKREQGMNEERGRVCFLIRFDDVVGFVLSYLLNLLGKLTGGSKDERLALSQASVKLGKRANGESGSLTSS